MTRARRLLLGCALLGATSCTPCAQSNRVPHPSLERMIETQRADPLDASHFFADGTNVRTVPPGAVAFTGLHGATNDVDGSPKLGAALLDEGEERFDVMCAACHGLTGDGDSVVAQHMELVKPRDLHIDRLRNEPPQYFYDVATHGYGMMPSYADRLTPRERWAVAYYVKALQLSRHASTADVDVRAAKGAAR